MKTVPPLDGLPASSDTTTVVSKSVEQLWRSLGNYAICSLMHSPFDLSFQLLPFVFSGQSAETRTTFPGKFRPRSTHTHTSHVTITLRQEQHNIKSTQILNIWKMLMRIVDFEERNQSFRAHKSGTNNWFGKAIISPRQTPRRSHFPARLPVKQAII